MSDEMDRVLGHPTRAKIVELVGQSTRTPEQLAQAMGQAVEAVSYHSTVLVIAGYLTGSEDDEVGHTTPLTRAEDKNSGS